MDDDVFSGPTAAELVDAVIESLTSMVSDVPAGRAFELRSAIGALGIVRRELDRGAPIADAHRGMLADLGCTDDAALAESVRSGERAVDADLLAALLDDARRRLAVDSPRFGSVRPTQ